MIGSSILFGLAHRYQGWSGVGKTGAVGVVMGILYLATGSLWAPMLLHAVLDVTSGTVARQALAGGPVGRTLLRRSVPPPAGS